MARVHRQIHVHSDTPTPGVTMPPVLTARASEGLAWVRLTVAPNEDILVYLSELDLRALAASCVRAADLLVEQTAAKDVECA